METRKVPVVRHVEQVYDGSHYKGYMKIAETKLDYELVFTVPIPQLDELKPAKDRNEIRRLFQLTVRRDNTNIELTEQEYGFFIWMLLELAVDFYNDPQTRASNRGVLGMPLLAGIGVKATIGMTSTGSYEFPPELCAMLSAPKFGCTLAG
jgi:hypothetical protein